MNQKSLKKAKFKVGDIVRLSNEVAWMLQNWPEYNAAQTEMWTIEKIIPRDNGTYYYQLKGLSPYIRQDGLELQKKKGEEMMAGAKTEDFHVVAGQLFGRKGGMQLEVFSNGPAVICLVKDENGKTVGKGVAKCSKDDEFDFFDGAKLAMERAKKTKEEAAKTWLPSINEMYYYPAAAGGGDLVGNNNWVNDEIDQERMKRGLVFKTREEARAAAQKMLDALKPKPQRKAWMPKPGTYYYRPILTTDIKTGDVLIASIALETNELNDFDRAYINAGLAFKTAPEALAAAERMLKAGREGCL